MSVKQHHAWLFAFADLAFLLLITISLIPARPEQALIEIYQMNLPRVPRHGEASPVAATNAALQLWVYQPSAAHASPYKLVRQPNTAENPLTRYVAKDDLIRELLALKSKHPQRPLLIPEPASHSEDLLHAAAAVSQVWSDDAPKAVVMVPEMTPTANRGERQ